MNKEFTEWLEHIEDKRKEVSQIIFKSSKDGKTINLDKKEYMFADLHNFNLKNASLKQANLRRANLERANLKGANLEGADCQDANFQDTNLEGANLKGANLSGCTGNGKEIITLQTQEHIVVLTKDIIFINHHRYTLEDWKAFTDKEISKMLPITLTWWDAYKFWIFEAVKINFGGNNE